MKIAHELFKNESEFVSLDNQCLTANDFGQSILTLEECLQTFDINTESGLFGL